MPQRATSAAVSVRTTEIYPMFTNCPTDAAMFRTQYDVPLSGEKRGVVLAKGNAE